MFAAYYWIVGELIEGLSESSIDIMRNYTFIFVFTVIYSATFTSQKIIWKGGKSWYVLHIAFILLYLVCYMFKFWPQTPVYYPQFTVRAFFWYGGACAMSFATSYYGIEHDQFLKSTKVAQKVYLIRSGVFVLSALVLVVPLALSVFSGSAYNFSPPILIAPLVLVVLASLFFAAQEKTLNVMETITHLITQWFSLGACFLVMPILFLADLVVSNFYGDLFEIESNHLITAIIAFGLLTISFSFLPALLQLVRHRAGRKN